MQVVAPGDEIEATLYVGSNHDGLYRYELACGRRASMRTLQKAPSRRGRRHRWLRRRAGATGEVGWTRADTDAYFQSEVRCQGAPCAEMAATAELLGEVGGFGAALRAHSDGQWPTETCRLDPSRCFLTDRVTLPEATTCRGPATLRMIWNAGEGPVVYASCVDLAIWDGGAAPPTPPPPATGTFSAFDASCLDLNS